VPPQTFDRARVPARPFRLLHIAVLHGNVYPVKHNADFFCDIT
jgi:hypothetical protein